MLKEWVAHLTAYNDLDAIRKLRNLFSYIPQNNNEKRPDCPMGGGWMSSGFESYNPCLSPDPYDIKEVIPQTQRQSSFFEILNITLKILW